jgi:hypothetical protein
MSCIKEALKAHKVTNQDITSYKELPSGCVFCCEGEWFSYDKKTTKITKGRVDVKGVKKPAK